MLHWLAQAFSTYVLHSEHADGYQWWSGPGSDLSYVAAALTPVMALAKHHNCHHKGCWLPGHRHPEHGWPACKAHWNEIPTHVEEAK